MHILHGSETSVNPFLGKLISSLSFHERITSVYSGITLFWLDIKNADILHLHWPESLFLWREPDAEQLRLFKEKIMFWKSKCRIVSTVHNLFPHKLDSSKNKELYNIVYQNSDAIIHFGNRSEELFYSYFNKINNASHHVIPHGDYTCFNNTIPKMTAKKSLNLDLNTFVCLSFGHIRNYDEMVLLREGFKKFKNKSKVLLIAGKLSGRDSRLMKPYEYFRKILNRNLGINDHIHVYNKIIPDYQVQYFLNASDLLVIPRIKSLNSGNVALGFTFGKVVVGPDYGVIGELLRETGNPTFNAEDSESFAKALNTGYALVLKNKGAANKEYSEKFWNWQRIADMHVKVYSSLL